MARRARNGIEKSAAALLAELARQESSRLSAVRSHGGAAVHNAKVLVAADLARQLPGGGLEITDAGRAHLARASLTRNGSEVDPFTAQHLALAPGEAETASGRARVTVDLAESPLAWLARRKGRDGRALIEPAQLQAGERLRADFTRAQMMPRITANWTSSVARDGQITCGIFRSFGTDGFFIH